MKSQRPPRYPHRAPLLAIVLALASTTLACGQQLDDDASDREEGKTSEAGAQSMTVDLQDGFNRTPVEVLVDGVVAFEANEVTTSLLEGFADGFTTEVEPGTVDLEVRWGEGSSERLQIDLATGEHIGISIAEDGLVIVQSESAFGYG